MCSQEEASSTLMMFVLEKFGQETRRGAFLSPEHIELCPLSSPLRSRLACTSVHLDGKLFSSQAP